MFGDYIDIYDISRAVEDDATVPIYYESRLARIELDDDEKPKIDAEIAGATEDEAKPSRSDAQAQMGKRRACSSAPRSVSPCRRGPWSNTSRPDRGAGRQGDDRLHEPQNLRRALRGDRGAAARVA